MSYEVVRIKGFSVEAKKLAKRYKGFTDDLDALIDSLSENPWQGVEVAPNIRKICMSIRAKGRGKS